MQKVVVDSSVILKWLNQKDELCLSQAEAVLQDAKLGQIQLLAPELAKYEIGNTLLVGKKLSPKQLEEALDFFFALPIQFFPDSIELANNSYKIGYDAKITYYDAAFLALAKQEEATLVTDNIKHQNKTTKVKVIPLKDY